MYLWMFLLNLKSIEQMFHSFNHRRRNNRVVDNNKNNNHEFRQYEKQRSKWMLRLKPPQILSHSTWLEIKRIHCFFFFQFFARWCLTVITKYDKAADTRLQTFSSNAQQLCYFVSFINYSVMNNLSHFNYLYSLEREGICNTAINQDGSIYQCLGKKYNIYE